MSLTATHEHCMDLMWRYPDNYFDLAVVDPPYFDGPQKLGYYRNGDHLVSKIKGCHNGGYWVKCGYPTIGDWTVPDQRYFDELFRVSKNQIIWGVNYFQIDGIGSGRLIWDKVNGASSFSDCEIAYCSAIDSVRLFSYMWNGFMQGDPTDGKKMRGDKKLQEKRIHATQKPVILYNWLLDRYAKPGYKVLDTHLGSGTIAIACHYMNIDLTACEKDKTIYNASLEFIDLNTNQLEFEQLLEVT